MLRTYSCLGVALLLGATAMVPEAKADLALTTGATNNFTVAPNGNVNVPIYIRESNTTGAKFSTAGGLFSSGFLAKHTGPADNGVITNVVGNPAVFDAVDPSSGYSDTTAGVSQNQDAVTSPGMPTGGLLLLGTVSVQGASTLGVASNFSLGDFDPSTTQFLTYNFNELDNQISAGSFVVTTTPEPAVMGLLGVAIPLLLKRRKRSV